jgi:hypothetical protein
MIVFGMIVAEVWPLMAQKKKGLSHG